MGNKKRGNFTIEELVSIPTFFMPKLNYGKDKLAFYWNKTGRFELYLMDLESKDIEQITDGHLPKGIRAGYLWGRDDKTIYFTKDNDGDEKHNIHCIDVYTKETKQLTDNPDHMEIPNDTSPDGKWLLFNANPNKGQINLYRMDLETSKIEQLTDYELPAQGAQYSKDGSMFAYVASEEQNLQNRDIYIANADGSEKQRVVQLKVGSKDMFADWSSDGTFFIFTTDVNGINQVALYNRETEDVTFYGKGKHPEFAAKIINDETILAISNADASASPVLYNIKTKEKTELEFPKGIAVGTQLINDEEVIMTLNSPVSPSTFIRYNFTTQESTILLETDTGTVDKTLFVDAEYIKYPSTDDAMIPALVYKPRDFDPDKLYPALIIPHGGPTYHYNLTFSENIQYFADLGYVVMLPNVRGSDGYGAAFRDACIKDWGGPDHDDWIAGRKWMIDHASVDPKKVVVFGGSYGGYAALWCMGKSPDLWAAGVAFVPVSDLHAMYEESNEIFKFFLRLQMGDPVEDKELWIDRSPITHIQNFKAPLLIMHGVNDPRCPISQSRLVVEKLKNKGFEEGKDFEYVEFADEGHGSSGDIQGTIRTVKILDDFLYRKIES